MIEAITRDQWRTLNRKLNGFHVATAGRSGTPTLAPRHVFDHDDHGRLVVADSQPGSSWYAGGAVFAYRLEPTRDHQDLVNMKPAELEPLREEHGRYHGQLVRTGGRYYILIGPPLEFHYERPDANAPITPQCARYAFVDPPDG